MWFHPSILPRRREGFDEDARLRSGEGLLSEAAPFRCQQNRLQGQRTHTEVTRSVEISITASRAYSPGLASNKLVPADLPLLSNFNNACYGAFSSIGGSVHDRFLHHEGAATASVQVYGIDKSKLAQVELKLS